MYQQLTQLDVRGIFNGYIFHQILDVFIDQFTTLLILYEKNKKMSLLFIRIYNILDYIFTNSVFHEFFMQGNKSQLSYQVTIQFIPMGLKWIKVAMIQSGLVLSY